MMDSAACWQNSVAMHQACGTVRLCPGLNSLFATNATTHERWTCSYPWHTGGCFDFGSVWRERNMSHCGDFYKCLRKAEARDNVSVLHSSLASAAFGTNHHLAAIQRNACASTTLFSLCLSKVVHDDGSIHKLRLTGAPSAWSLGLYLRGASLIIVESVPSGDGFEQHFPLGGVLHGFYTAEVRLHYTRSPLVGWLEARCSSAPNLKSPACLDKWARGEPCCASETVHLDVQVQLGPQPLTFRVGTALPAESNAESAQQGVHREPPKKLTPSVDCSALPPSAMFDGAWAAAPGRDGTNDAYEWTPSNCHLRPWPVLLRPWLRDAARGCEGRQRVLLFVGDSTQRMFQASFESFVRWVLLMLEKKFVMCLHTQYIDTRRCRHHISNILSTCKSHCDWRYLSGLAIL